MSERKKVWGLYMWGSNEWWMKGKKRMRFDTPEEAFDFVRNLVRSGNTEGFITSIRPFYARPNPLPADVQELIEAARAVHKGVDGNCEMWNGHANRLLRAVRALDGKY